MRLSRRSLVDATLLLLVNTMWAAQYAAYKIASERIPPLTLSTLTFLLAALALLPFRLRDRHPRPAFTRRDTAAFVLLGLLGLVPASAFLAWGASLSTASNAAILYLTVPVLTALLAALMLGERMTALRWLSLALAMAGVLILSEFDLRNMDLGSRYLAGNLLVLGACASSSFYNVYSKGLLRRFAPLDLLICGYLVAAAAALPFLSSLEGFTAAAMGAYSRAVWLSLGVLSVFSWGIAMVLWMFLLRRLDVTQASISIYLLPFLGVAISAVTLHEAITPRLMAGGLLTLAGTVLATLPESSHGPSGRPPAG